MLASPNDTHQRAGAIRVDVKADPTAGSVACDCSPLRFRSRARRRFDLSITRQEPKEEPVAQTMKNGPTIPNTAGSPAIQ